METSPAWTDEDAVITFVKRLRDEQDDEEERDHYERWRSVPRISASEIYVGVERNAVDLAKGGNIKPLADLLDPSNPFNSNLPAGSRIRDALTDEAWKLLQDRLHRRKIRRGRPKVSQEERNLNSPVHDAATDHRAILHILKCYYPDRTKAELYDRALRIAADRHQMDQTTLDNYLRRPVGDRRRL